MTTLPDVGAFNAAMATAVQDNPGISGLPQFDSNYIGNGTNDLANKAYAAAHAIGITSIDGVNINEFIDSTKFNAAHAGAMMDVMRSYWSEIGYNPDNDILHGLATSELDAAALIHDQQRIAAGGDLGAELAANATFANSAISAFFDDLNPTDLVAAVVIGIGESGLDVVTAGVNFVGQEIVNVGHVLANIFSNLIRHDGYYDPNDNSFNDSNFDYHFSDYDVSITMSVGYVH